jgi:hypothetical protein
VLRQLKRSLRVAFFNVASASSLLRKLGDVAQLGERVSRNIPFKNVYITIKLSFGTLYHEIEAGQ